MHRPNHAAAQGQGAPDEANAGAVLHRSMHMDCATVHNPPLCQPRTCDLVLASPSRCRLPDTACAAASARSATARVSDRLRSSLDMPHQRLCCSAGQQCAPRKPASRPTMHLTARMNAEPCSLNPSSRHWAARTSLAALSFVTPFLHQSTRLMSKPWSSSRCWTARTSCPWRRCGSLRC